MAIRSYWLSFIAGLPVTVHLHPAQTFRWTRIYGFQIGPWFIGAIKGSRTV